MTWRIYTWILEKRYWWHTYFISLQKNFFLAKLTIFLSSKLGNIKFNYEKESSNSLPFLDVLTLWSENYFRISIFHKLTLRLVHSNSLNRLISYQCKIGLVFALLFRTFWILSDFSRFHVDGSHLNKVSKTNAFPTKLINNHVKIFFE